jgi:hypothetical protein
MRLLAICTLCCAVSSALRWSCPSGFKNRPYEVSTNTVVPTNAACCEPRGLKELQCSDTDQYVDNVVFACEAGTVVKYPRQLYDYKADYMNQFPSRTGELVPSQLYCCAIPTCGNVRSISNSSDDVWWVAYDCGGQFKKADSSNMINPSTAICCESFVSTCMSVTKRGDYFKCQNGTKNRDVQIGSLPTQTNCCEAYTPTCDRISECKYSPEYDVTSCYTSLYNCPSGKMMKLNYSGIAASDENCCEATVPTCAADRGPFTPFPCPGGQVLKFENLFSRQVSPEVCCQAPTCSSATDETCQFLCSSSSEKKSLVVKASVASNVIKPTSSYSYDGYESYCCTSPTDQASGADAAFPTKLAFSALTAVLVDMLW